MLVTPEGLAARVAVTVRAIRAVAEVEVGVAHKLQAERAVLYRELPALTAARARSIKAEQPELVTTRLVVAVTDITVVAVELATDLFRLSAPMAAVVVQGI